MGKSQAVCAQGSGHKSCLRAERALSCQAAGLSPRLLFTWRSLEETLTSLAGLWMLILPFSVVFFHRPQPADIIC